MFNRHDRWPFPHRGRLVNALGRALVGSRTWNSGCRLGDPDHTPEHRGRCWARGYRPVQPAVGVARGWRGGRPWRGALTGDYELGLRLIMSGQRSEYTQDIWWSGGPARHQRAGHATHPLEPGPCSTVAACDGCEPHGTSRSPHPGSQILPDPALAPAGRDVPVPGAGGRLRDQRPG